MPLKTRTYDLREERDRKDERLDELADREADLLHTLQDDEQVEAMDDSKLADLRDEYREIRQEAQIVDGHYKGLSWAVEEFGPEVATDGGQPAVDDTEDTDRDMDEVRKELETSEETTAETDDDGQTRAGTASVGEGKAGRSEPSAPASTTNAPTVEDATGLEVELTGLTAGEFAHVQDLREAHANRMGFGREDLAEDGYAMTVYVAAGHGRAPYLSDNASLQTKTTQIQDTLSPEYVQWCQSEIEDLTTPPSTAGNGYASRVQARIQTTPEVGQNQ